MSISLAFFLRISSCPLFRGRNLLIYSRREKLLGACAPVWQENDESQMGKKKNKIKNKISLCAVKTLPPPCRFPSCVSPKLPSFLVTIFWKYPPGSCWVHVCIFFSPFWGHFFAIFSNLDAILRVSHFCHSRAMRRNESTF
ncbi:hypothetical protein PVNG_03476 [Plasmodium vivax North Korean]|uniref:Uncharacterized protein n=1 Tax=Plasmodium vivax North Korean TaxID=1035514 RepID=A0A0J9TR84_PLAVI|nr:hypothetical protein PVNG_03476 [Plasmodium vivax North Korean]